MFLCFRKRRSAFPVIFAKNSNQFLSDITVHANAMDRHPDTFDEQIAHEYTKPPFAYSKSRTANLVDAEELTGEILLQIYDSLRKANEIHDLPRGRETV